MLSVVGTRGEVCCYLLFEDFSPAEVATSLRRQVKTAQRSWAEAVDPSTRSFSVGSAAGGWTVVTDPQFLMGDDEADLVACSVESRVVRLLVIDDRGFSHAKVWSSGGVAWEVSMEAELDDRPLVGGRFPYDLDELARSANGEDGPRTWYQVPILAVQRLTGWRAGLDGADSGLLAELVGVG